MSSSMATLPAVAGVYLSQHDQQRGGALVWPVFTTEIRTPEPQQAAPPCCWSMAGQRSRTKTGVDRNQLADNLQRGCCILHVGYLHGSSAAMLHVYLVVSVNRLPQADLMLALVVCLMMCGWDQGMGYEAVDTPNL
jgi:hypothetical protein